MQCTWDTAFFYPTEAETGVSTQLCSYAEPSKYIVDFWNSHLAFPKLIDSKMAKVVKSVHEIGDNFNF